MSKRFDKLTEIEKKRIVRLYAAGNSVDSIVRLQPYGEFLVYRVLHEAEVPIRKLGWYVKHRPVNGTKNRVCNRCGIEQAKRKFGGSRPACRTCEIKRSEVGKLNRCGLTPDDYAKMVETQGGLCAVCGLPETKVHHTSGKLTQLAVDHNHATGKVRELLCNRCNTTLGRIQEDVGMCDKLKAYILKHEETV